MNVRSMLARISAEGETLRVTHEMILNEFPGYYPSASEVFAGSAGEKQTTEMQVERFAAEMMMKVHQDPVSRVWTFEPA